MDEFNPYQAPQVDTQIRMPAGTGRRIADLQEIASYQRAIIICILLQFMIAFLIGMHDAMVHSFNEVVAILYSLLLALGSLGLVIAQLIFFIRLASKLYHPAVAAILAILMFCPCVNLLVLLAASQRATRLLRQHGYRVGFFGADMSQFEVEQDELAAAHKPEC